MKNLLLLIVLFIIRQANAQRIVIPMEKDWQFKKENDSTAGNNSWTKISLPHTWNALDVMDDTPDYFRGVCYYSKKIRFEKTLKSKEIYLEFGAVNQQATIFINGKKAGEHIGGYTAFNVCITQFINWESENEILVEADNSFNKNIPPLTADFTFYGGMYRQASVIAVNPVHFSFTEFGNNGIQLSTPSVSATSADVKIKGLITNKNKSKVVTIITTIFDATAKKVAETSSELSIEVAEANVFEQSIQNIDHPKLWSPDHPNLYKVVTKIKDKKTKQLLDESMQQIGFRWFRFDADKGFYLNDTALKLMGASRHQDYKGLGNAVPAALARKDVVLLKQMGANFLRVAHYPQNDAVLKACDELGIIASVEIPVVNEITESDSFYHNCMHMQVEMIRQNYNHPSVVMWCYMNEVLLRLPFNNDKDRQTIYYDHVRTLAKSLDSITRMEDPNRYTMLAAHGDFNKYKNAGLLDIPQVVGWNLYSGWYGANLGDLPVFLDKFHTAYPAKPMMITEYGADADPRIHSNDPVRFDKGIEYATIFHQYYFTEMMKRPFVAAGIIWNLADFNSETRIESMPHINNKGLLQWNRKPKDQYYYYKAVLDKKPFVKILGDSRRGGSLDGNDTSVYQKIQVASNLETLELFVNKQSLGKVITQNGIAEWRVPFKNGGNIIEAAAVKGTRKYSDKATIKFTSLPYHFDDSKATLTQMNILLGAKRSFIDSKGQLWLPDHAYQSGGWGSIGGASVRMSGNNQLPYGTNKNITNTFDDPIYQTQQTGIKEYRIDVPAGAYELTLHFAELIGDASPQLVYNLDTTTNSATKAVRIFDVFVNDNIVLKDLNIARQYGTAVAVTKVVKVKVQDRGINILFKATQGEAILNALQLKRVSNVKRDTHKDQSANN